jgi:hypothetical protein
MAEGDEPKVVAEFVDYGGLIDGLRRRAAELNLSGETIDAVSGLPSRYSAKLLGPQQIRKIGATSLGPFFGALAVRGVLLEDRAALARLRKTPVRNLSYVRSTPSTVFTVRWFRSIGRKGAQARIANSTKQQRQEWARNAAITRWRKGVT